jgi:predicted dehydrogenase
LVEGIHALKGAEKLSDKVRELGLGSGTVCESVEEVCRKSDIVAVFVPNFAREQVIKEITESLACPRFIVCEKPFARNIAEGRRILDMIIAKSVKGAYFENQIFMPAVTQARRQLVKVVERMGPVNLVRTAEEHGGPHEPWFWDPTRQGGGVWSDMGCHSVAIGEDLGATASGGKLTPCSVSATLELLKWYNDPWLSKLKEKGVDYTKTPAEDFAQVSFVFKNERGRKVVVLATDSWMYEAPGLRLSMEAMGPGYALGVDTLKSPSGIFISDSAAESLVNAELAVEKSQASRGQLVIQPNEADLYGYVGEWRNAIDAYLRKEDGLLDFKYAMRVVKLIIAGYYAHEQGQTIDLEDGRFLDSAELVNYVPLIQQGRGADVFWK